MPLRLLLPGVLLLLMLVLLLVLAYTGVEACAGISTPIASSHVANTCGCIGPPGDLYVFLTVKTDKNFKREGADIYSQVPTRKPLILSAKP